ncbi:hypothetical protein PR048_022014 [Dryococelus australis]|uniref:Uncharacterized protein n=1 Tax=Dryococelus australis TaxID=614101 RepID=A0ABQ9GZT8_9NEOP|nr:hypothetical protein PR048_022014 [Dryococelus australis]
MSAALVEVNAASDVAITPQEADGEEPLASSVHSTLKFSFILALVNRVRAQINALEFNRCDGDTISSTSLSGNLRPKARVCRVANSVIFSPDLWRVVKCCKSKYRNRIRLERAPQKQLSDTHKTPHDRVKRCRERKINIKASESVNPIIWCLHSVVHTRRTKQEPVTKVEPGEKDCTAATYERAARYPLHTCCDVNCTTTSEEVQEALQIGVLRADEGEAKYRAASECKGGRKLETLEQTRRLAASSGTIPCENPGATPPGIELEVKHGALYREFQPHALAKCLAIWWNVVVQSAPVDYFDRWQHTVANQTQGRFPDPRMTSPSLLTVVVIPTRRFGVIPRLAIERARRKVEEQQKREKEEEKQQEREERQDLKWMKD